MRSHLCSLISAALLLTATGSSAQGRQDSTGHLLARLSYNNTLMEQSNDQPRKICFAVYDNGLYRLWRPGHMELRPRSRSLRVAGHLNQGANAATRCDVEGYAIQVLRRWTHRAGIRIISGRVGKRW